MLCIVFWKSNTIVNNEPEKEANIWNIESFNVDYTKVKMLSWISKHFSINTFRVGWDLKTASFYNMTQNGLIRFGLWCIRYILTLIKQRYIQKR